MNTISNSVSQVPCYKAKDKSEKKVSGVGAFFAADAAYAGVTTVGTMFTKPLTEKLQKSGVLPDEQVKIVHEAGEKALKQVGLADKVKINYFPKSNEVAQTLKEKLSAESNPIELVKAGKNAFFTAFPIADIKTSKLYEGNSILLPEKDIATTVFHEIGHSMNYNLSKLGKMRILGYNVFKSLPAFITLYAIITRKSKPDENGEYTKGQKAKNFIRNNAGILSFIGFSPVLIEEWMATSKGKKLAKDLLSPELLQKYTKGTKFGFASYAIFGLFSALAAHTAVKVKDKIIAKKEAKLAMA